MWLVERGCLIHFGLWHPHPCIQRSMIASFLLYIYYFTFRSRIFHLCEDVTITGATYETKGLIDSLLFYVPLKNFSCIWRRHHCRWGAVKFRPMLGAQGLWAGRDLNGVTPTVTWGLGSSSLIRRTAPFSRLLRHTMGCGGSFLTRIFTCEIQYLQFLVI
jgi:hypothetical protein